MTFFVIRPMPLLQVFRYLIRLKDCKYNYTTDMNVVICTYSLSLNLQALFQESREGNSPHLSWLYEYQKYLS